MTTYDFVWAKQAILSNVWTDLNLIHFHSWSTFHTNWYIQWPHMTSYRLNKRFWAMFELTSTWPNFAFGQLLTWIATNNDHIWIPKVNSECKVAHIMITYEFLWSGEVILSTLLEASPTLPTWNGSNLPIWNGSQLYLARIAQLSYFGA